MLGAIAGDVIGSVHEAAATKTKRFRLFTPESCFTDDTVLTIAVAECILDGADYVNAFHKYFRRYPNAGYGGSFALWAETRRREPYNSWGNGSAMRVSPIGFAFDDLPTVLAEAERCAAVTHNHPEGIKGAQATATAILLARQGHDKPAIQEYVERTFGYDLSTPLAKIRRTYLFDVSCQGSVPQALRAFLEADDFEDAVRNAISLGGDADTMACIAGGVAEAFYRGVPPAIAADVADRLGDRLRDVVERFYRKFGAKDGVVA
jgi:ADP-ribosylglycohydrolase